MAPRSGARQAPDPLLGRPAPDVALVDHDGAPLRLAGLRGSHVVLYFYPRDLTPGCTTQACGFQARLPELAGLGAEVVGVSPDDPATHRRFRAAHGLAFRLASDPSPDRAALRAFGVWKEKRLYGRTFWGVERSTFLLEPAGTVAAAWRRVRPTGHAEAVAEALRARCPR